MNLSDVVILWVAGWPIRQMDYINTSHPGFIGGSKAVEIALNQQRGAKALASKVTLHLPFHPCGVYSDTILFNFTFG